MKQKIVGTILILILYSIFIIHFKTSEFDIAQIIGTILGLLIFPGVLATIINYIHGKFSRSEKNKWFNFFIVLVIIFTISNLVSTLNKVNQSATAQESFENIENGNKYIYSPQLSNFKIEFPKTPTESKTFFNIGQKTLEGEMMELTTINPETVFRVEYLKDEEISKIKSEQIIEKLNELAYSEGMNNPKLDSKKQTYGEEYNLRMFKNLESKNKISTPITYHVKLIKMENKIISITTACQSEFYPTLSITEFLNSLDISL